MGLSISLEKVEEARDYLLYAFGPPNEPVGRVRLYKSSGDIELATFSETADGPDERYYLAHVVPRLQTYQDDGDYPDSERWEV
jgi:hypothetical protein